MNPEYSRKKTQIEKKPAKLNSALQHVRADFRSMMSGERRRDDTRMASMKIVQFSRTPTTSLSVYVRNSSTTFALDVKFQTNAPL